MYSYIVGNIAEILEDRVIVENNGIGYEVFLCNRDLLNIYNIKDVKLYTYFHVREDAMQLFGFIENSDKTVFLKLIDVSGVGVKTALGILSTLEADKFMLALENGDVNLISKCPGIGKKTAQRIILELKGKLVTSDKENGIVNISNSVSEAFEGLIGLGFSENDIKKFFKTIPNIDKLDTSEIIKVSLKGINNA